MLQFLAKTGLAEESQCIHVILISVHQHDSGFPFDEALRQLIQQPCGDATTFETR